MRRFWGGLCIAAIVLASLGSGAFLAVTGLVAAASTACGPTGPPRQVSGVDLDAEQLANAALVIDVTARAGLPARAAVIAVATALQESSLRNLDYGDAAGPDSRGLFQQRTRYYGVDVATDPARATQAFLALLVKVPGWQSIPLTVAAATVQRPRADLRGQYARWEQTATDLVSSSWPGAVSSGPTRVRPAPVGADSVGDTSVGDTSPTAWCDLDGEGLPGLDGEGLPGPAGGGLPAGYTLPTAGQGATAVQQALAQLGKPYLWGGVGPVGFDCSGLTMTSWAAAGVAIPRTAAVQATTGIPVAGVAAMQPGDLIFIAGSNGSDAKPGHNGMYIGEVDGVPYLVHAPQSGRSVEVRPLSRWDGLIVAIRRPVVAAPR